MEDGKEREGQRENEKGGREGGRKKTKKWKKLSLQQKVEKAKAYLMKASEA